MKDERSIDPATHLMLVIAFGIGAIAGSIVVGLLVRLFS